MVRSEGSASWKARRQRRRLCRRFRPGRTVLVRDNSSETDIVASNSDTSTKGTPASPSPSLPATSEPITKPKNDHNCVDIVASNSDTSTKGTPERMTKPTHDHKKCVDIVASNSDTSTKGTSALPSTPATLEPITNPKTDHKCVALDCEMVGVGPGGNRSVLARVSVVGWDGKCLFDAFVRVPEKVTDYRTRISGVRPEDLAGPNALDFGDCRRKVQALLRDKILVGHGLKNDLEVMRLTHPWYNVRDTSLYEPFMRFDNYSGQLRPQKLRTLAQIHLGRTIQQEGHSHDSCVDAQTAMDLYKSRQVEWDSVVEISKARAFHYYRGPRPTFYQPFGI